MCQGTPVFVPLSDTWELDVDAVLRAVTPRTKAIFLCSPNNPTGNSWSIEQVTRILETGIPTIVDQAYVECGFAESFALVAAHPNRDHPHHVEGLRPRRAAPWAAIADPR
jgi:histidinol-phosphate aminotransferase